MFGLGLHLFDQPRPLNDVGEPRIVLDVGGRDELAARLHARDQDRLAARAGGVDRGRVSGRTCAQDNDVCLVFASHVVVLVRLELLHSPAPHRPAFDCAENDAFDEETDENHTQQSGEDVGRLQIVAVFVDEPAEATLS